MAKQYVAGHYTITLGGTDLGSTENGYNIVTHLHEVPINDDEFGEGAADGIQAGADYEIEFTGIEWPKVKAALGVATTAIGNTNDNVGKLMSGLAQTLIITPVAGTPAAATGNTLTATKAIVVSDYNWNAGYQLRKVPVRLHLYPDTSASNKAYTLA